MMAKRINEKYKEKSRPMLSCDQNFEANTKECKNDDTSDERVHHPRLHADTQTNGVC